MLLFRAIVFTSVLVGLIAGSAVSAAQFFGTSPLIQKAEVYEKAAEAAGAPSGNAAATLPPGHNHDASGHSHDVMAQHAHEDAAWEPADGLQRYSFTIAANILTAIGYGLVLTGLMALRGKPVTWRQGMLWGLAGFGCVMLAPMFGLPPELPGTPAGPLVERQIWWIGTAVATAAAFGLIAFQRRPAAITLAIALLAAPHVIGAPATPDGQQALAPEALQHQFVIAAVLTSLLFWVLLGSLSGGILRKFETPA